MTDEMVDVAIVGGGPAGQAAAMQTRAAGLSTCIIDEQQRPGGQILRQPPRSFDVVGWMGGRLYRRLREQLRRTEADAGLRWIGGTSVTGLWAEEDGFRLSVSGGQVGALRARRVLVAAGCYDMPVALPGWTTPGVMSAGGLQTLIKGQQLVPGQEVLLFGTHPLMLVLAYQLLAADVRIKGVLFAQPLGTMLMQGLSHAAAAFVAPGPLRAAMASWFRLRRASVPIRFDASVERLNGDGALIGAQLRERNAVRRIDCDLAAMCFGFLPQSDLPRMAGAKMRWSQPAGGWETVHDAWMRSDVPGLYVAGETSGVSGADAALLEGELAGLAMAMDAGQLAFPLADRMARPLRRALARLQPFIAMLRAIADPRPWLPAGDAGTIICRCEDVTLATVDDAITQARGAGSQFGASAIKLRCRAGMGLCQGRSCEHMLMRRIATQCDRPLEAVTGFRSRYPVRPVAIDELLG